MCLVLEIGMLIFGLIALITGKFSVSRNKVVRGAPARVVGGIMLLPLPLALLSVVAVGLALGLKGDLQEMEKHRMTFTIVEAAIVLICFIAAMVVGAIYAGPPDRPRRRRRDEEDEYYRAEDGYEDDQDRDPRPRREPDDRPRRRPDDDRIRE
jgi:hypothetical protein